MWTVSAVRRAVCFGGTGGVPRGTTPTTRRTSRRRLVDQSIYGIVGLFFTAAAAGVLLLIGQLAGDAPAALWRLVWIADAVLGAVSLLFWPSPP